MIDKIWNRMHKIKIDKLWHFIAFREFTAILLKLGLSTGIILFIAIFLAIGKELIDWYKGEGVDPGDLLADGLGILLAFMN